FSKRFLIKEEKKITGPQDIVSLVEDLRKKKQEHFVTLTLDGAHNLIKKRTVFIGTLNQSLVHPREVFADAISDRAAAVILIHNHPSGNVEPSDLDISLTKRLIKAGELLGIEVLDHIIIGKDKYSSFKEIKLI
ncbi:MAG: DNA repair protein RadC, partial [Acidobacteriota bacterium]|nr:DNA repair protein RadC [Acidobacteriota bacterium]